MAKRIFTLWLAALALALVLAQAFFSGEQSSEIAGNLAFALLILCLPSSLLAYPLALTASSVFESQGLFPYNSRLVLSVWWAVFFSCGMTKWLLIFWFLNRRKPNASASLVGTMKLVRKIITLVLWFIVVYSVWSFLKSYSAPDTCLDLLHGSFDYEAWSCSLDENKPYIETPIYLVPGFKFALCSLIAAVVVPRVLLRILVKSHIGTINK
jgi:hypothetical protein